MKHPSAGLVFIVLFIVFFALCATIPVPFVMIDWVQEPTPWNKIMQTMLLNGPTWAGLSLMGAIVGTALFAITRHIVTYLRRH